MNRGGQFDPPRRAVERWEKYSPSKRLTHQKVKKSFYRSTPESAETLLNTPDKAYLLSVLFQVDPPPRRSREPRAAKSPNPAVRIEYHSMRWLNALSAEQLDAGPPVGTVAQPESYPAGARNVCGKCGASFRKSLESALRKYWSMQCRKR